MRRITLLIIAFSFYISGAFSQKEGKFEANLVLPNNRTLTLAKPGTVFSQVLYSLQPEVTTSKEKETYNIDFDLVSNEVGKTPFTSMVIGPSPYGNSWSFRIQHSQFTVINNADGSLHYSYTFTVDRPNGYAYGVSQRFVSEVNQGVGCYITNLRVTYKEDQMINANLMVNRNIGVNGRMGIGVVSPSTELDVAGTIRSKEVKIEATGWSDFVFDKNYKLPALSDIEAHIKEYKHLPDMPSESEVLENGISIGEMQSKLLQKIEELTLYTIELEKEINTLKEKLVILKIE
jgi:hypothetical protein